MTDQDKILSLTGDYAYIRAFFRGRIQMIKAMVEAGCVTQARKDCDTALEWLDKLENPAPQVSTTRN